MKQIFTRLLHNPPPNPDEVARVVTRVPWRNEEARIYHWHKATPASSPVAAESEYE